VTGYMLSNVFVMPLIAWLSARFGRKRMYVASVVLFTGASMCCGLARTLPMMVTFRVLNLLLVQRFIRDPSYLVRERGRVDVPGIALLALGLGALQFMLEEGQRKDWFDSSFIVTLAVASGLGLALFVWRELATDRPAVDLRILKSASFSSATALGGVLGMGLYGSLFLLPLFMQNLLGYPAETSASRSCPAASPWPS